MSDPNDLPVFLTPQMIKEIRDARKETQVAFGRVLGQTIDPVKNPDGFTRGYIWLLERGMAAISPEIQRGAMALGAMLDGTDPFAARLRQVVGARSINDVDDSVILGTKKKCALPACRIWFVGVVPNQKYHSPLCRLKHVEMKTKGILLTDVIPDYAPSMVANNEDSH